MRLAELSNNSGGVATTFEKTFGHHGLTCYNSGREHDEIEKEKQQETFIFVCLKMFREGHTRWAQIPHAVYFPPKKSARLTFAV